MKKNKYYKIFLILIAFVALIVTGCTKNFEKINTNPTGTTNDVIKADYQIIIQPLVNIQQDIVHRVNWSTSYSKI